MGGKNEPKTPIMPVCTNWYYTGGANCKGLSDNSFQLAVANSWSAYTFATKTLSKKYSDLVGKTVVIDYDINRNDVWVCSNVFVCLLSSSTYAGGISGAVDRKTISSTSNNRLHYHREIAIGVDYTASQTSYQNYYLSVGAYGNSSSGTGNVVVSNFQCYVKGE